MKPFQTIKDYLIPPPDPLFLEILELLKNKDDWQVRSGIWGDWIEHKTKDIVWDVGLYASFMKSTNPKATIKMLDIKERSILEPIAKDYHDHFVKKKQETRIIEDRIKP